MTPRVGSAELARFYTDAERFPELDPHGVAFVLSLLMFVNTSGKNAAMYGAHPSIAALAGVSRLSRPTVMKWARYFAESEWLTVTTPPRSGSRRPTNHYSVLPAVAEILRAKRTRRESVTVNPIDHERRPHGQKSWSIAG